MTVLTGPRIATPDGIVDDGFVEVHAGRIVRVGRGTVPGGADDVGRGWLVPGFVDLHVHGGGGHDATGSLEEMRAAVAFHRSRGTTRTLVSLMTAPVDQLVRQLEWVAELGAAGEVFGAHLEGPFLAAARCGAQNRSHLLDPDTETMARLVKAADGWLRTVTLAPELPGALELVRRLAASGIVPAVGHTDASYEQAMAAFDAGAGLATHLFNAMGPLTQRAPGPGIAALDAGVVVELINDGVHVHDALVRLVARSAPDRLALVTDAISATGMADGHYRLGGLDVDVHDGQARLSGRGTLAGSTLTMAEAFRRGVTEVGLPVGQVVAATSTTPARTLGLDDRCGAIRPGLEADLVLLDESFELVDVMVSGRWAR